MITANRPVSHQQMGDVEEYVENWATNGYWTLSIPFVTVALVVLAIIILTVVL